MKNRFSHITSKRTCDPTSIESQVKHYDRVKDALGSNSVRPQKKRIGREAFDTLMGLLAEDSESPTTPYGVLVANSTKRNLKKQIEDIFEP
ncbi:hypothetical protein HOR54_gp40 [Vibrio phage Vp670]|uniref:Uncharacterized protein n=1 Tax=Vibrio phage Vp670 TaxID=1932890 RepID=A0A1L7DPX3_9CAUD|nr:hypothetical protein HOR54_gp40 [Vibrio phage Vp670]APU00177.1 hypothetical protein QD07_40 [Vibrio phage Vp670]